VSFSLASLVPLVLSGTAVLALLTALALAWQAQRRQRQLASRLGGATVVAPKRWEPARLRTWRDALLARVAAARATDASLQERLIRAGFSSPAAPAALTLLRWSATTLLGTLGFVFGSEGEPALRAVTMSLGVAIGYLGPMALLDRLSERRQLQIRLALPDALDLLIICLEAGVSQDAALQRVARELVRLHPVLGRELTVLTRRITAGMPRDEAFQQLHPRTGVDELRTLASHFIQADKWGTSITQVLRVYSEQLRTERRLTAERRAATAATRMLFPLALFIFPTLFVVLLGPAVLRVASVLGGL